MPALREGYPPAVDGPRPIVFVTDFGLESEWVGICHAVMCKVAPACRVIDLSHFIEPLDVEAGARMLSDSLGYLPDDAVLLAVVDPNVGKDRDIAVETGDGRLLVGPDNGLMSSTWAASGGARRAVEITSPDVILGPVVASFHARDVLCPAAAHLASGMPLEQLGDEFDPGGLVSLVVRRPQVERGKIRCEVIDHNRFGNIQLNVRKQDLGVAGLDGVARLAVEGLAGWVEARRGETFADFAPGEYGVIFDPRGWLTIVRGNPGNAIKDLHLSVGDMVWITAGEEWEPEAQTA
jgi:S-adenosyl-L-methionine hydrolase (adenosine-forming)